MRKVKRFAVLLCCIGTMGLCISGCKDGESKTGVITTESTEEVSATGAWKSGTFYFNDWKIAIECPEVGHPSGDSLWSTDYRGEKSGVDIYIDFYGKEGSLEEKKQTVTDESHELTEGKLWGNECSYYVEECEETCGEEEMSKEEYLVVLLPMDDKNYLQIEIRGDGSTQENGKELVGDEQFQSAFSLEIQSKDNMT